jgi:hypothetical protein
MVFESESTMVTAEIQDVLTLYPQRRVVFMAQPIYPATRQDDVKIL